MSDVGVLTVHHEDEPRRRACSVVNSSEGFEGVGEAASAEEAIELAVALAPDLVLVAAGLPGIDGFETSRRLIEARPATTVVLLYASVEPKPSTVAGAGAAAALHVQALTPASLQSLWEAHGTR
jgi:two-component system chemotaxis response regulator CheB